MAAIHFSFSCGQIKSNLISYVRNNVCCSKLGLFIKLHATVKTSLIYHFYIKKLAFKHTRNLSLTALGIHLC